MYILALKVYILGAPALLGLRNDQRGGHITFSTAIYGLGFVGTVPGPCILLQSSEDVF